MNYLAHLKLSPPKDDILMGNYVADSVRPSQMSHWNADMIRGYYLHLSIDRYTDAHPAFVQAKKRLREKHGKYAPVVLDILNDHLLALHWEEYHEEPLIRWADQVYRRLEPYLQHNLPDKAWRLIDGLIEHRYLEHYQTRDGIYEVLRRMDQRASFTSYFAESVEQLYEDKAFYDECFHALYSALQEAIPSMMQKIQESIVIK